MTDDGEVVERPSRVIRLAAMARTLLTEIERIELDDAARHRLAVVFNQTVEALRELVSAEMQEELERLELSLPPDPTTPELQVAQAQLVGWLEGLFHGIRTAILVHERTAHAELFDALREGQRAEAEEQERQLSTHYL